MAGYSGGYSPLAGMLSGYGGYGMGGMGMGNPNMAMMAAYNPSMLMAQPQIQLGNELMQQGVSAAPIISPWQGLSKLAGVLVGKHMIDKAYGQLNAGGDNSGQPDSADQAFAKTLGDPNSSQVAYFNSMPEYQKKVVEYQVSGDILKDRAQERAVKSSEPVLAPGQPPIVSPVPLGAEAGANANATLPAGMTKAQYDAMLENWKAQNQPRQGEAGFQVVNPAQTLPPAPPGVGGAGTPPVPPSAGGDSSGTQGAPHLTVGSYYRMFRSAEGSGPNAVSDKGAHGVYQLTQGTFNQYARKGEDFNNEDDRQAVAQRAIDDLYTRYGSDPQRMATAYFSGEGNVAPPGSPTPWKSDISDGHTLTSQYAAKFPGSSNAPASGGAPKTVAQALRQQHQQQAAGQPDTGYGDTGQFPDQPTDAQGNPLAVPVTQSKSTSGQPASTSAGQPPVPEKPAPATGAPLTKQTKLPGGGTVTQYGTNTSTFQPLIEEDTKELMGDRENAAKGQGDQATARSILQFLPKVKTGWAAPQIQEASKILAGLGVDNDTIAKFTGTNPAMGDYLTKQFLNLSMGAARNMGAREPGSVIQMFSKAYPNLGTTQEALQLQSNAIYMDRQRAQDLANAKTDWLNQSVNGIQNSGGYRGLKGFNEEFNKTHSAESYLYGAEAMAGHPEAWRGAKTPEQQDMVYNLIPSGTAFLAPDGQWRVKP